MERGEDLTNTETTKSTLANRTGLLSNSLQNGAYGYMYNYGLHSLSTTYKNIV